MQYIAVLLGIDPHRRGQVRGLRGFVIGPPGKFSKENLLLKLQ
jgi:hypothetical protein